ncbi:MAG: selenocysteine-specific elongation factor [Hyphomicrobiaceae bacterium]|jgi:selenocysteine-specific elongation factor
MRCVLGTAGHIDHGKSALVHALTGIETDRLPEEQRRGISIELGFAWLALPEGDRAAIVDVPGHERFVRHMLAGAHGFDVVLVVVAADDGVMPQTEEHFEIVHLLGVQSAIFVITKTDLVDAARISEVEEEIEILADGTLLEGSPVFPVSSTTGDGIDALREAIVETLERVDREAEQGPLRLPVDRAFRVRGHGLVATGTALAGSVRVGDEVEVLPQGGRARVRELQSHGETVEEAGRGQRIALNLSGSDAEAVVRGSTVVGLGGARTAQIVDAQIEIRPLAGRSVRSHTHVRLHLQTQELRCRLVWLDEVRERGPREVGWAQLIADQAFVAARGDRFVLRDETGVRTLGGGRVSIADVRRRRGAKGAVGSQLAGLDANDELERVRSLFALRQSAFLSPDCVRLDATLSDKALDSLIGDDQLLMRFTAEGGGEKLALRETIQECRAEIVQRVQEFHSSMPDRTGMDLEALRRGLTVSLDARVFRNLVETEVTEGGLQRNANLVSSPSHRPHLDEEEERLAAQLLELVRAGGSAPPVLSELANALSVDAGTAERLAGLLVSRGTLTRISNELHYCASVMEDIERQLRSHLLAQGEVTAGGFRDLISASRKYCIPLLDHLDRSGVTIRVGDVRKLRD